MPLMLWAGIIQVLFPLSSSFNCPSSRLQKNSISAGEGWGGVDEIGGDKEAQNLAMGMTVQHREYSQQFCNIFLC